MNENNNIVIFPNKFKKQEKDPTATGKIVVNNEELSVAVWRTEDANVMTGIVSRGNKDTGFSAVGNFTYNNLTLTPEQVEKKHPDRTGSLTLGDKTFGLALWKRQGAKGPFLAGRIQDPNVKTQKYAAKKQSSSPAPVPTNNTNNDIF